MDTNVKCWRMIVYLDGVDRLSEGEGKWLTEDELIEKIKQVKTRPDVKTVTIFYTEGQSEDNDPMQRLISRVKERHDN